MMNSIKTSARLPPRLYNSPSFSIALEWGNVPHAEWVYWAQPPVGNNFTERLSHIHFCVKQPSDPGDTWYGRPGGDVICHWCPVIQSILCPLCCITLGSPSLSWKESLMKPSQDAKEVQL